MKVVRFSLNGVCLQLNQKLRETTEDEEPVKPPPCTELQPTQDTVRTTDPHAYVP